MSASHEVTIIGGGIAGLYTAYLLLEKGYLPVIYEKSDRVGGHIQTQYERGYQFETCASRFNQSHTHLLKLLDHYDLHVSKLPAEKEFHPVLYSNQTIPDPSPALLNTVFRHAKTIPASQLETMSFQELCKQALGDTKTKLLVDAFGYNAEFVVANASTMLSIFETDFRNHIPYYQCHEGLTELLKRMEKDLVARGCQIYTNHFVESFDYDTDQSHFHLFVYDAETDQTKTVTTNTLFLALPKEALLPFSFFTPRQKKLLNAVQGIPLHRIFMKYPTPAWFEDLPKTTTDLPIRQFIPSKPSKGLAQVSYSDLDDADYWKMYADMGSTVLEEQVRGQLQQLFPNRTIPPAQKVFSYYWRDAVHLWKAKTRPSLIRKELQKIHKNLFIVGESYSEKQGWIEGALETVAEATQGIPGRSSIPKNLYAIQERHSQRSPASRELLTGGGTGHTRSYSMSELQKRRFPWLLLRLPGETKHRVIDISKWANLHPGGPYTNLVYSDVTLTFLNKSVHWENGKVRDIVRDKVDKYTVGYVS